MANKQKSRAKASPGNSLGNTDAKAGGMAEVAVDTLGSQELPRRLIEESPGHGKDWLGWSESQVNQALERLIDPDLQTSTSQPQRHSNKRKAPPARRG
jgi:hypothetical protein